MTALKYFGLTLSWMFPRSASQGGRSVGNAADLNDHMLRDINLTPRQRASLEQENLFWAAPKNQRR
ncbi:MAG: hypothetical protein ACRECY_18375 [Phyllobacterium sp.]